MLTKQDTYLKGGKFDPQAMIDFLRRLRPRRSRMAFPACGWRER